MANTRTDKEIGEEIASREDVFTIEHNGEKIEIRDGGYTDEKGNQMIYFETHFDPVALKRDYPQLTYSYFNLTNMTNIKVKTSTDGHYYIELARGDKKTTTQCGTQIATLRMAIMLSKLKEIPFFPDPPIKN